LGLDKPEIIELRNKIELRQFLPEQEWPNDRPARVIVEFKDGLTISRECMSAKGGPDRPFTEEEILKKVSQLTSDVYPNLAPALVEFLTLTSEKKVECWDSVVARLVGGNHL